MSDPRTDRPAGRQVPAKLTDEGSFVSCPARRQCPPNTTAASAATYPLRCSAPQWARFDNRHSTSAPAPILSLHQRQRRKRYKRSPEPTTTPTAPIPRSQHRQIRTCPPRAKGSLNRRFEWFSLVTFFLQKKKVTRAGARNSPSHARRRNTCSPPERRNPPRAKGSLDRRSKWFSLVTFFLQKKKVTRAGARNSPSRARRRNTCSPPGQRSTHPPARRQKNA